MNRVLIFLVQAPAFRPVLAVIKDNKHFTIASTCALFIYGFGAGLTFITQLFTARIAGPEAFGEYAYVAAWIALLASITTLGFTTALLRLLPAYQAHERWAEARGAARFARIATAVASSLTAILGAVIVITFIKPSQPSLGVAFLIGFIALPFVALQSIGASISRSFGSVLLAMAPERIVRDLMILTAVSTIAATTLFPINSAILVSVLLLAAFTSCNLSQAAAWWLRPPEYARHAPAYSAKEWTMLAAPLILLTLSDNLLHRSGVLVLGLTGNHVEAGIFAIAVSFAQLAAMPRMAVAIMFAPTAAAIYSRGNLEALQLLLRRAAVLSLIGTLCIAAPLLIMLPIILPKFGPEFTKGIYVSFILIGAQIFSASCGPQQHLLTMTGHERNGAKLLTIAACSSVAVSFIVVDIIGMIGVALVMSSSLIAWNIAMIHFLRKKLNIDPGIKHL